METNAVVATISHLNGLIKQKRNAEVKSILLKELQMNLINKRESTLVHTAVVFNNIELIAVLFSFGFNINAQNSLGQTPLLLAAYNDSYQAIQLLLSLDADIFVDDFLGENVFKVLLNKQKKTPVYIIGSLSERLYRCKVSPNKILDELLKADCPLEYIVKFNDPEVMRQTITRKNELDDGAFWTLLESLMNSKNVEQVCILLQKKPKGPFRFYKFIEKVTKNVFDPITKPFFEQIFNWELVDRASWYKIEKLLTEGNEDTVQLLLGMGIEKYCKQKFDFDVLVRLFANNNVDIIELIRDRQFDVKNSRDEFGNSALHVSTAYDNERAVIYLLDNGVDPNAKNHKGKTPLFLASDNDDISRLLLEAGADLQVMSLNGESIVTNDFAVASLMIAKARGTPISKEMYRWIYSDDFDDDEEFYIELRNNCESHSQDLKWMKTRWVSESITLFTVLTEKCERLARYVKYEKTCEEILKAIEERVLKPTYEAMIKKNLKRAREVDELRFKAATFLRDQMLIASEDHLVIRAIIGFLTYKDLMVFRDEEGTDAFERADEKFRSNSVKNYEKKSDAS